MNNCCILNQGNGAWAFENLASQLAQALAVDTVTTPRRLNYVLALDSADLAPEHRSFIPLKSIQLAADKRALSAAFRKHRVPIPNTRLLETFQDVRALLESDPHCEWCLKYPTSCGANGHRLITCRDSEPANWPRPFVVQEFIRMEQPEVFRTYCAGGEMLGWMVRRFPEGTKSSPWVAHARGARYANCGEPPFEALTAARKALIATGLFHSFGCVDLLRRESGEWLVLEVGTDGLVNHVDRDVDDAEFIRRLHASVAKAFWLSAERFK